MKKFLAFLALLVCVLSAPQLANAWNDPGNLYFFKDTGSGNGTSAQFSKNGTVYTYTVDATAADVLGVIVDQNVNHWDNAHSSNSYFPKSYNPSQDGDHYSVPGAQTWDDMQVVGSGWKWRCLKFEKGNKYDVTITYNNGRIDGKIEINNDPVIVTHDDIYYFGFDNWEPIGTAVKWNETEQAYVFTKNVGDDKRFAISTKHGSSSSDWDSWKGERYKLTNGGTLSTGDAQSLTKQHEGDITLTNSGEYKFKIVPNADGTLKSIQIENVGSIVEPDPTVTITKVELFNRVGKGTKVATLVKNGNIWEWSGSVNEASDNNWDSHYFLTVTKNDGTETYYSTLVASSTDIYSRIDANTGYALDEVAKYTNSNSGEGRSILFNGASRINLTVTANDDCTELIDLQFSTKTNFSVLPKAVRDADGDWSVMIGKKFAYIKAEYLNNNRLQPGWEMTPDGDDFVIENATLRNYGPITVVVYTYDGNNVKEDVQIVGNPYTHFDATGDLQYGKPFNIRCNYNQKTLTFTKVSDIPPFISMVGYNFRQNKKENTPANGYKNIESNTDTGWQESWVLYGPQGEQMRDDDGNLMFSTHWPPINPIYFKAVKLDDNNNEVEAMEMSSENLIFNPTYNSKAMTRAEWTDSLSLKGNGNYDNLWKVGQLQSRKDGNRWADVDGGINQNTQKYVRYVINNMWILGSTKLWTGWTAGSKSGVANWSPYMNWGVCDDSEKGDNDSGYLIDANSTYTLKQDKSNFLFQNPTYFKTVELFIPVKADGSIDLDNKAEGARLYTTPAMGDAYIRAHAYENRCGEYVLGYDLSKFTNGSDVKVLSWTVTRYDATESDMTSIYPKDWTPVGTHADASDFVVAQGGEITNNVSNGVKFNTYDKTTGVVSEWNITDKNLDNGRYFYGLHIVYELNGAEVEDDVMSNIFSVANYDFEPVCVPLQLIRLNLPADDELVSKYSKYDGQYLTYRPSRTGRYYIVDPETEQTVTLDDNEANSMILTIRQYPRYYTWTAKYYVAAFDGNNYASVMRQAANTGEIEPDYSTLPDVYVAKVADDKGTFTASEENKAVRSVANRLYGRIFDAQGSLEPQHYQAQMGYSFTPTGETKVVKNPETNAPLNNSITPVVPKPYGFDYAYEFDTELPSGDEYHKPVTQEFKTVSDITNDTCVVKVLDSDYEILKARNCHARIYFKQPNVDADILKKYNIFYNVTVTNSHNAEGCIHNFTTDGVYYDEAEENQEEEKRYSFLVKNVYPDETHQPKLIVNSVDYRSMGDDGDVNHLIATYPSEDDLKAQGWANQTYFQQEIEAVNAYTTGRGATIGELTIGLERSLAGIAHVQFRGHKDFKDTGTEDAITRPGNNVVDDENRLVPNFYHIETEWSGRRCDNIITEPFDQENFPGWTQNGNGGYYSVPTLWKHTSADASEHYYWNTVLYPAVPLDVTMDELKQGLKVTFTPLYLFLRQPSLPENTEIEGLVKEEKAAAKAPERNEGANSTPSSDGLYVVLRGAPAVVGGDRNNFGGTTGIENVLVDADVEAEYYNIQGMRILNPVKGQVYVVRRGATVTKELYN